VDSSIRPARGIIHHVIKFSECTDEDLIAISISSEPDVFGEIVRRWDRKIFALCFGMLGREDEARDATQETFIAAYRSLKSFRGDSKVSSWLHRIAINKCLTVRRRQRSRPEEVLNEDMATFSTDLASAAGSSPARVIEQDERLVLVRRAISTLPPDLRQVVVMKEFEEMTFQEISETLEVPLSTVKSRLYTALKQLRMKLDGVAIEIA
jgi:RNA polymerase sigma-70 factor, ECF subfamily